MDKLVPDVSRIDIGEDENVRLAGNRRIGSFEGAYGRHDCGIRLKLAVNLEIRCLPLRNMRGLADLIDAIAFARPIGGIREQRHASGAAAELFEGMSRGDGYFAQLLSVGIHVERAIAHDKQPAVSKLAVRHVHDERR